MCPSLASRTSSLTSTGEQSFIGGPVAYKVLPRSAFATLQTGIFPVYFGLQTALPLVLAITFPGVRNSLGRSGTGFAGVMDVVNRSAVLVPLATMFLSGLSNLIYFGPATTAAMRERKHQGTAPLSHDRYVAILLTRSRRDERWQEGLRPCASFSRDAEVEQKVRNATWCFLSRQYVRSTGNNVVWCDLDRDTLI